MKFPPTGQPSSFKLTSAIAKFGLWVLIMAWVMLSWMVSGCRPVHRSLRVIRRAASRPSDLSAAAAAVVRVYNHYARSQPDNGLTGPECKEIVAAVKALGTDMHLADMPILACLVKGRGDSNVLCRFILQGLLHNGYHH